MTREQQLHADYVACDEQEQEAQWRKGEVILQYLRASSREAKTPREARQIRAHVFRDIAALVKRTTNCVKQQCEVYAAFGLEPIRSQMHPWCWHRAVLNAARRNKLSPAALITEAIEKRWHIPELNALGRTAPEVATCTADCAECGAHVAVRLPGNGTRAAFVGMSIRCAVCVETLIRDGGDPREAPTLGTLE